MYVPIYICGAVFVAKVNPDTMLFSMAYQIIQKCNLQDYNYKLFRVSTSE